MKRPDITPGPWTFEPMKREQPAEFVVFHDSGSVCRLYEGTRTRQQPNAKAIAALPLCLGTLEACLLRDDIRNSILGVAIKAALMQAGYTFD